MNGATHDLAQAIKMTEQSHDHLAAREASYERSDTDGFLSQWSSGICASRDQIAADIAAMGGLHTFIGLYQGERRVRAKIITTQFGSCWLLADDETELRELRGKPFLPAYTGDATGEGRADGKSRSRVLKSLGLVERMEWAPAEACITGSGTGLSGNAWASVRRTGAEFGDDAVLVQDGVCPICAL